MHYLIKKEHLRIHDIVINSSVNGPGKRFVIWTQGCNFYCPDCFNPKTHPIDGGNIISIEQLYEQVCNCTDIEGITISGGEPFLQIDALNKFIKIIKSKTKLSIILFTGYTFEELSKFKEFNILKDIDILISGRYEKDNLCNEPLRSSKNQEIHFFSKKYSNKDIGIYQDYELIINQNGDIIKTGFIDKVND